MKLPSLFHILLFHNVLHNTRGENLDALEGMLNRITEKTLEYKRHVESLLLAENMCSSQTIDDCYKSSYDGCLSEYPSPTCPGGIWAVPDCGKGNEGGCGALFDFTASTLRLAPSIPVDEGYNPVEDSVKNTICYTKQAEEYMIQETFDPTEVEYWGKYSTSAPWYHYGTEDGIFRIFPGNPKKPCPSTYDPRVRPWYVAGSSGPKDVVLVLDTSGSMQNYGRMDIMKEAAIRVINTLGFSDFVSVVEFNSEATSKYTYMNRATTEMKEELVAYVKSLSHGGQTNFHQAFDTAFDILEQSIFEEKTTNCHKAILFLTDGIMTSMFGSEDALFTKITNRLQWYDGNNVLEPVLFTYSFGAGASDDVPKRIACSHDGIWARVNDGEDLAESMAAYYKYFAYGLSNDEDFVTWVEPYQFATGVGLGTTASAPVYDRSVNPPVFAGVVGLDFSFSAMEKALGEENEAGKETVISKMVTRSIAQCPALNITECQREALSKSEERCSDVCSSTNYEIKQCPFVQYPSDVYHNKNNADKSYEERACCSVGETREIGQSDEDLKVCKEKSGMSSVLWIILGCTIGGLCVVGLIARYVFGVGRKKDIGGHSVLDPTGRRHQNSSIVTAELEAEAIQAIPVPPEPSAPPMRY